MFCSQCGSSMKNEMNFCSSCRAKTEAGEVVQVSQTASPRTVGQPPRKNKFMDLLVIPVAIILILIGTGHMALAVVGRLVTAQVIGYEQVIILNNDDSTRNPSRYKLEYQFSANGERYDGSVTRVFEGGSHMRKTLPVRYLPFWPRVNAEDDAGMGLVGPAATGLGVLVLVLAVRKKSPRRNAV